MNTLFTKLRALFRRRNLEAEMAEEMQQHLERRIQENIADGVAPHEARFAAQREFGGIAQVQEQCRDERRFVWLEQIIQDLRFAGRTLRKSPGFTVVVVLTLALGIGANTSIFQLLDAVKMRNLPVSSPQELVEIRVDGGNRGFGVSNENSTMTHPLWEALRSDAQPFSGVFAWGGATLSTGKGAQARNVAGLWVSGELFSVLGIAPVRGRLFAASDDRRGSGPGGAVISYAFWQREFGGADDAIGKTLLLDERAFTIIGVTPPEFFGLEVGKSFEVALPISVIALWSKESLDQRHSWWLRMMARLKPDWTCARAGEFLRTISPALMEATAPTGYDRAGVDLYRGFRLNAFPAPNGVSGLRAHYEKPLWVLFAITGLVLLIACANIANLFLTRAAGRETESAIRVALGASRQRLIRHSLAECLILAAGGAALGAVLAGVVSATLLSFLGAEGNQVALELRTDWRVFGFLGAVALLTCVLFGVAPTLHSSGVQPITALKKRGSGAGREKSLLQRGLVVLQVALSLVLLSAALLLVRSFWNLARLNPGFQKNGLVFAGVQFWRLKVPTERIPAFQNELVEKISAIPGVESAALTTHQPLTGQSWEMEITMVDRSAATRSSKVSWVGPGFFRTMRIPVRAGRDISDQDAARGPKVALVNEAFQRVFLGEENPIGRRLRTAAEPGYPETEYEIIGVVADTKYSDLRAEIPPIIFAPAAQFPAPRSWTMVAIRCSGNLTTVDEGLRRAMEEINPEIRVWLGELASMVRKQLLRERLLAYLSAFFGALAALLVVLGLYGVVSYATARRTNEFGIRLALGAQRRDILGLVLGQGMKLSLIGIALGLVGATAATHLLRNLLFGVGPTDPLTLGVVPLVLLGVALLSCWLPARRATKVDPMTALRAE